MARPGEIGRPRAGVAPGLAYALDAERMLPSVGAAVGIDLQRVDSARCSAKMLNHKPGNRCTIRYVLGLRDPTGNRRRIAVIGKHFAKTRRAARAFQRLQALQEHVGDRIELTVIPAPLSHLPEHGIVLLEFCPGTNLADALRRGGADRPVSLAGGWLAVLHRTPSFPGLKVKSIDHELEKVDRRLRELAEYLPGGDGSRLQRTRNAVHQLVGRFPDVPLTMIHRDYYHENLIWDGAQVGILDFDQLAIGDPAMDVGHFLAHLSHLALRETGRHDAFADGAQAFIRAYFDANPTDFGARLPFFTAYTFVKLAHQAAEFKPLGWRRLAGHLIHLACAEGESMLRGESR